MVEEKYTGILLAGGQSSRMGKEKGLIFWKGKTFAQHAIDILSPLCTDFIISTNTNQYDSLGFPVVGDVYSDSGPMGGILSALKISNTEKNLVIPSDTPFVSTEIYRYLISHAGSFDAIVPIDHESFYQPLCAIYSRSILPAMEAQITERVLGFAPLFSKIEIKAIPFHLELGFYDSRTFYNINLPADLEAIS
ncbi:MAG: molybdenum cofactor guanylyltransferase [Bacteroidales bacterium]|nr:molybdenum cofactor guanylyltransferase [Bacteroidales bacterium]